MQFRMSPGGMTPRSSRNRPELPPSSVTVTMTDKAAGPLLSPRRSVDKPVPPPIETILGFEKNRKGLLVRWGYQILECLLFRKDCEVIVLQSLKPIFSSVMYRLLQVSERLIAVSL